MGRAVGWRLLGFVDAKLEALWGGKVFLAAIPRLASGWVPMFALQVGGASIDLLEEFLGTAVTVWGSDGYLRCEAGLEEGSWTSCVLQDPKTSALDLLRLLLVAYGL